MKVFATINSALQEMQKIILQTKTNNHKQQCKTIRTYKYQWEKETETNTEYYIITTVVVQKYFLILVQKLKDKSMKNNCNQNYINGYITFKEINFVCTRKSKLYIFCM